MISDHPPRISLEELDAELATRLASRTAAGWPAATVQTDKTKAVAFLRWLETRQVEQHPG